MLTAINDFELLTEADIADLVSLEPKLAPIFEILRDNSLRNLYKELMKAPKTKSDPKLRKLSVKADKEMKSRIFAIFDY